MIVVDRILTEIFFVSNQLFIRTLICFYKIMFIRDISLVVRGVVICAFLFVLWIIALTIQSYWSFHLSVTPAVSEKYVNEHIEEYHKLFIKLQWCKDTCLTRSCRYDWCNFDCADDFKKCSSQISQEVLTKSERELHVRSVWFWSWYTNFILQNKKWDGRSDKWYVLIEEDDMLHDGTWEESAHKQMYTLRSLRMGKRSRIGF